MAILEAEDIVKQYAGAHQALADEVELLNSEILALKKKRINRIKRLAEAAAEAQADVSQWCADNPRMFEKPRTHTMHGVRFGYQKSKGKIVIHDEDNTIQLIRKHFVDEIGTLVKVKESVIKSGLKNLSVDELKRIAVTVEDTGDSIVVKTTDSEIEKIINAYLEDETLDD